MADSKWGGIAELARDIATDGMNVWHVEAELRRRVEPLLEAAKEMLDVMETCHICEGALLLDEHPVHCENCSSDCENHAEPECKPIYVLHAALRKLEATWRK